MDYCVPEHRGLLSRTKPVSAGNSEHEDSFLQVNSQEKMHAKFLVDAGF